VDPVSDPLLLRKSGSTGNRTRAAGSVAENSDHFVLNIKQYNVTNKFGKLRQISF
jgi:hypothetical protein